MKGVASRARVASGAPRGCRQCAGDDADGHAPHKVGHVRVVVWSAGTIGAEEEAAVLPSPGFRDTFGEESNCSAQEVRRARDSTGTAPGQCKNTKKYLGVVFLLKHVRVYFS